MPNYNIDAYLSALLASYAGAEVTVSHEARRAPAPSAALFSDAQEPVTTVEVTLPCDCCDTEPFEAPADRVSYADFLDYEDAAASTALFNACDPGEALPYLIPGLAAEAGEVAGKWAKFVRDYPEDHAFLLNYGDTLFHETVPNGLREDLIKELGDTLWFIALIARSIGSSLGEVASTNVAKLTDRKTRNVLAGSGDNR